MKSSLAESLMKLVDDGLRVFRTRDGVRLTDEQIEERTNNIVAALLGNYLIVSHVEAEEPLRYAVIGPVQELPQWSEADDARMVDWNDPRISRWEPGQYRRAFASREELAALYADGKPRGHLATCRCDKCDTVDRSVKS